MLSPSASAVNPPPAFCATSKTSSFMPFVPPVGSSHHTSTSSTDAKEKQPSGVRTPLGGAVALPGLKARPAAQGQSTCMHFRYSNLEWEKACRGEPQQKACLWSSMLVEIFRRRARKKVASTDL